MTVPLILHHHIFKNGGSSFDFALRRQFGDNFIEIDDWRPNARLSGIELERVLQKKHIAAASSHHFHAQKLSVSGRKTLDVVFLRHPVLRLASLYRFLATLPFPDPIAQQARERPMGDFFAWLLAEAPSYITSPQTIILAWNGRNWGGRRADAIDLDRAKNVAENMFLVGIVEAFDDSILFCEHALRQIYPDIDLAYRYRNATQGHGNTLDAMIEHLRGEVGDEIFLRVEAAMAVDMELWTWAQQRLIQHCSGIAKFRNLRRAFYRRCAAIPGESESPSPVVTEWTPRSMVSGSSAMRHGWRISIKGYNLDQLSCAWLDEVSRPLEPQADGTVSVSFPELETRVGRHQLILSDAGGRRWITLSDLTVIG